MACFPEKIGSSLLHCSNQLGGPRPLSARFQLRGRKGANGLFFLSFPFPWAVPLTPFGGVWVNLGLFRGRASSPSPCDTESIPRSFGSSDSNRLCMAVVIWLCPTGIPASLPNIQG